MKKLTDIIRVFLASPGDTSEERHIVKEIIGDLNRHHGRDSGFRLDLITWEEDSYPDVGVDAQDVINRQLSDYDIFLGLMNTRFGSATNRAGSGTEEEFDRAYERYLQEPRRKRILFYFRNPTVKFFDLDINQAIQVHKFRKRIANIGVFYHTYETLDGFRRRVSIHLLKAVRDLIRNQGDSSHEPAVALGGDRVKIDINDWQATTKKISPQWANYREIDLAVHSYSAFTLKGTFHSASSYFRFGFKLLTAEGRVFGEGNIQSHDNNIVVHIGKNVDSDALFLTSYYNGVRQGLNTPILDYDESQELDIVLSVQPDNLFKLSINDQTAYETYVNPDITKRLLMLTWGDEYEYEVHFRNISLHLIS